MNEEEDPVLIGSSGLIQLIIRQTQASASPSPNLTSGQRGSGDEIQ